MQQSLWPAGFRLRRSAISACFCTLADGAGRTSSAHHDRVQGKRSAGDCSTERGAGRSEPAADRQLADRAGSLPQSLSLPGVRCPCAPAARTEEADQRRRAGMAKERQRSGSTSSSAARSDAACMGASRAAWSCGKRSEDGRLPGKKGVQWMWTERQEGLTSVRGAPPAAVPQQLSRPHGVS